MVRLSPTWTALLVLLRTAPTSSADAPAFAVHQTASSSRYSVCERLVETFAASTSEQVVSGAGYDTTGSISLEPPRTVSARQTPTDFLSQSSSGAIRLAAIDLPRSSAMLYSHPHSRSRAPLGNGSGCHPRRGMGDRPVNAIEFEDAEFTYLPVLRELSMSKEASYIWRICYTTPLRSCETIRRYSQGIIMNVYRRALSRN